MGVGKLQPKVLKIPTQPLRLASLLMLISFVLSIPSTASANQIIDKQRSPSLSLDKTNNGVDLIHITAPNENLQSHNVFKAFNVDEKGAILNNSNTLTSSKLGGIIYANPNYSPNTPLAKEILLEVSGSTKSSLLGYLEIAGGKADLILSNPNGIYLNGAGFINIHNLFLNTTANTPQPFYDSKIEIEGLGADLTAINKAEFITQIARLNAPLYGGKEVLFRIEDSKATNPNPNNATKEEDTNNTSNPPQPSFGFDARILGSLYAGKITIIANKEGVGVKSEGGLYANADSLSINTKGEIVLKEAIAKDEINLKASGKITLTQEAQAQRLAIISPILENTAKLHFKDSTITTNLLDNQAQIYSMALNLHTNTFKNSGILVSPKLNIQTNTFKNLGNIESKDLALTTQAFNNKGSLKSNQAEITAHNLSNYGSLASSTLLINSNILENTDSLQAHTLTLKADILGNQGSLRANFLNMSLKDYNFQEGEIVAEDSLSLNANNLTLSKNLNIPANAFINLSGDFHNTKNLSLNALYLQANKIMNTSVIALREDSILESKSLSNTKNAKLLSLKHLALENQVLENKGEILSHSLNIHTQTLNNLSASIQSLQDFTLSTHTLNNQGSILQSPYNTRWYYPLTTSPHKTPPITTKDIFLKTLDKDFQSLYAQLHKPQGKWSSSPYVKNIELPNSTLKTTQSSLKAGGNLTITAKEILNQEAKILAGNSLNITTQSLQNTRVSMPLRLQVVYGRDYEVVENRSIPLKKNQSQEEAQKEVESIKEEALKEGRISNENLSFRSRKFSKSRFIYSYTLTKTITPEYKSHYATSLFSNTPTLIRSAGEANIQAQNILNQSFLGFQANTTLTTHLLNNTKDAIFFNNGNLSLQAHTFKNEGELRVGSLDATLHTLENIAGKIVSNNNASLNLHTLKNQGISNKTYSQRWVNAQESALILEEIAQEDLREPRSYLNAQRTSRKNGTWDNSPAEHLVRSELLTSNAPSFKAFLEVKGNLDIQAKEILNQEADILVGKNLQITANLLNNSKIPQYAKVDFILNQGFRYSKRNKWGKWGWGDDIASARGSTNQGFYSASNTSILVAGNANIKAKRIGNGELLSHHKNTQAFTKPSTINPLNPLLTFLIPQSLKNNALFSNKTNRTNANSHPTFTLDLSTLNNSIFSLNLDKEGPLLKLNTSLANFYTKENNSLSKTLASPTLKAPIESNPLYTDPSMVLSSDYFLKRLGFNPKTKLLGDNALEEYLISQSLLEQSSKNYLAKDYFSLRHNLLENALLEQTRLGLKAGMPLSVEQIKSLNKDILWYEYHSIQTPDGNLQEVLVPKVYLANHTLDSSSTLEAKGDLTLQANTLTNQANITAENLFASLQSFNQESNLTKARFQAQNNLFLNTLSFKNLGGDLKAGENLSINTQDFLNQSIFKTSNLYKDNSNAYHLQTSLTHKAILESKNIFIKAQDFQSKAALFKAKDSLFILAKDISLLGDNTLKSIQRGLGDNSSLSKEINHNGNSLESKNMYLFAKENIKSVGSNFLAKENILLEANNIYLIPGENTQSLEVKKSKKGMFKSTQEFSFFQKNTYTKNTLEGRNITLRAKEDLTLYGVDIKTRGDRDSTFTNPSLTLDSNPNTSLESNLNTNSNTSITLEANNILQAGVKDTTFSYHSKTSSSFFGLKKSSFKESSFIQNAKYALIQSDSNLTLDATSSLLLEGVKISSNNMTLKANTLEIKPLILQSYQEKELNKGLKLTPTFSKDTLIQTKIVASLWN
ncbi:filamentous hemagglutinin N-terminal domain-containing protein [Helicobacter mesocricetorum]|uniref:filamentous hemagglutinin N-terminal domain-containing protein n=1 Tax=Helicobacter mesocricetorum TaxID=87012 RepID=UPI000CF0930C|nr:filamentous hemagglutinin N-terminal domain-containing protein [Helicobacter mesocricetorum]